MTRSSRESRREARRAREQGASPRRWLLPLAGIAVVLVAAVAAIVLTSGSGADDDAASSARPSSPVASVDPGTGPTVGGEPLPVFEDVSGDTAVGLTIPTAEGADFSGAPVSIALDGRPKVLLFLAHWCSHCQAEVPVLQDWIDAGEAPTDVDIISVATSIDASLPNYPPEDWLAREGWTVPTLVDRPGTVAQAYGLSAFPFWVFVDGEGKVTGRVTGELAMNDLETIIDSIR